MKYDLSVVVVNYNGLNVLNRCVSSIYKNAGSKNVDVIVVDNNSVDESISRLLMEYPEVRVIRNKINYGFSVANNIGVEEAFAENILLLNSDAFMQVDLSILCDIVKESKGAFIGGKMYSLDGEVRSSYGRFPEKIINILLPSSIYYDHLFNEACEVDWIEGSLLLFEKKIWEKVSGFNEDIFMYGEDIELAKRAKLLGIRSIFNPSIKYIHIGGFDEKRVGSIYRGLMHYYRSVNSPCVALSYITFVKLVLTMKCILFFILSRVSKNKIYNAKFSSYYESMANRNV